MDSVKFRNRVLHVSFSTNDKEKRQANRIITNGSQRSTASPTPRRGSTTTNEESPAPSADKAAQIADIRSRTIALLNLPDTVNEARVRVLAEPYGELVKVSMRLNNQGMLTPYHVLLCTIHPLYESPCVLLRNMRLTGVLYRCHFGIQGCGLSGQGGTGLGRSGNHT